jgi:hypothetical protein
MDKKLEGKMRQLEKEQIRKQVRLFGFLIPKKVVSVIKVATGFLLGFLATCLAISFYFDVQYYLVSSSQELQTPIFASTTPMSDYIVGDDAMVLVHYPDGVNTTQLMYTQRDLANKLELSKINANNDDWVDKEEFDKYMKDFPTKDFKYRTINSYMKDLELLFGESTIYQNIVVDMDAKTIGFIYNEKQVKNDSTFYTVSVPTDTGAVEETGIEEGVTSDTVVSTKDATSGIEGNLEFYTWLITRYATSEGVSKEDMRDKVEILYTLTYSIASKMLTESFPDYKIIVGSLEYDEPYFMIEDGEVTLNNVM